MDLTFWVGALKKRRYVPRKCSITKMYWSVFVLFLGMIINDSWNSIHGHEIGAAYTEE